MLLPRDSPSSHLPSVCSCEADASPHPGRRPRTSTRSAVSSDATGTILQASRRAHSELSNGSLCARGRGESLSVRSIATSYRGDSGCTVVVRHCESARRGQRTPQLRCDGADSESSECPGEIPVEVMHRVRVPIVLIRHHQCRGRRLDGEAGRSASHAVEVTGLLRRSLVLLFANSYVNMDVPIRRQASLLGIPISRRNACRVRYGAAARAHTCLDMESARACTSIAHRSETAAASELS